MTALFFILSFWPRPAICGQIHEAPFSTQSRHVMKAFYAAHKFGKVDEVCRLVIPRNILSVKTIRAAGIDPDAFYGHMNSDAAIVFIEDIQSSSSYSSSSSNMTSISSSCSTTTPQKAQ